MIIPSIDLIKGKLVQLEQGENKIIELNNPIEIAKKFSKFAEIQLIDLDAALNQGDNMEIIKEICKFADCRVGGGIRTIEKARELINSGAKKIIIGTKANGEFLSELTKEIKKEKIIVALDTKNSKIAINGWKEQTDKNPLELSRELEDYCSEFLYTCIEKEGLLQGADFETIEALKKVTNNKISVAGGISTIEEIKKFDKINVDSVVGMAIYTNNINPTEAFIESLNFDKMLGLIPTIAKDEQGNVLMLAYSNKESLRKTIETENSWYFSRERKRLWIKRETSGNIQNLIKIRTDCDKDALLFVVKQKGNACHLNNYSCFLEEKAFNLKDLYSKIQDRMKNPSPESYTNKLISNPNFLRRKIVEESGEVITEQNGENLTGEFADLIYNIFVYMALNNISIEDIEKENGRRDKESLINQENLTKLRKEERK